MIGSSLGPYEIVDKLGEGGMGEVFLARDTRLDRDVAIKVLPEELATDRERLERFEREARAAAALNHPHIAAVFDVGVEGDTRYMVQERLQGETLRQRLDRGRPALDRSLDLAAEIAEALAAAHAAGIVHRDLKPENVFVSEDGHAKVLDFGLAKLTERTAPQADGGTRSPTVLGTSAGQIMGTAGYMAPEQITGDDVDERADVFAFGCLLYELASGERAFEGKNLPEVLHRLANDDPPSLEEVAPGLPLELRRIVRKCLAKDPSRRYQSAADLAVDLRSLRADFEAGRAAVAAGAPVAADRGVSSGVVAAIAVASLLLGASLYAALDGLGAGRVASDTPLHLPLKTVEGLDGDNTAQMALSPDGRFLAFAVGRGSAAVRLVDLRMPDGDRDLPGTEGARAPFFSSDARWLGYFGTDGRLYRVPVEGGRPQPFTERIGVPVGWAAWLESGEILFSSDFSQPVMHIAPGADVAEPLLQMDAEAGENGQGPASYLPGGDQLVYSYWDDRWRIAVRSLSTGERTALTEGYAPRYVPTGHLVWVLAEQLVAATFDPTTLALGEPVVMLATLGATPGWGRPGYDFTSDGTLAYLRAPADRDTSILRIEEDGRTAVLRPGDRELRRIELSPSGRRIAVEVQTVDGDRQVWSYDLDRGGLVPIAQAPGWDQSPTFSATGDRVLYSTERLGGGDLFARAADGSGEEVPLLVGGPYKNYPAWSSRGLLAARVNAGQSGRTSSDIHAWEVDAPDEPSPLVTLPADEDFPEFSPDGDLIAYQSNRTGRDEIYVAPVPGGPSEWEWQVSSEGGILPEWTADGQRLFFESAAGHVTYVEITRADPFRTGPPQRFTDAPVGYWDVGPDGSYVVAVEALEPPRPHLVLDWFTELKLRVPIED